MSKSRSTTPTNTNRSPQSASRHQIHDNPPPGQSNPAGEREEQQASELRPRSTPSLTTQLPSSEDHPHLTESTPKAMARRLRKESPPTRVKPESRSSPSSDSQGGMADTEDATRSQRSERSPTPVPPPKKKRTRTLTTPHQSAVLHALLAQSRFPTTAMREEVGRSIGLSARKVQIWFQNQRQKARRPRTTQSTPSAPPPSMMEENPPFIHRGPPSETYYPGSSESRSQGPFLSGYPSDSSYYTSGTMESSSRLLGPGMPGSETSLGAFPRRSSPQSPIAGPSHPFDASYAYTDPYPTRRSDSPPRLLRRTYPTVTDVIERDSRTLPPLVFSSRAGARSTHPPSLRSAPATIPSFLISRSPSPQERSLPRPHLHQQSVEPFSSGIGMPPPFTLQPLPQWDTSHFTTIPPAHSSSWSRPGSQSAHEGSLSPTSPSPFAYVVHEEEIERDDNIESSSRVGARYDPVRSSLSQQGHQSGSGDAERPRAPPPL